MKPLFVREIGIVEYGNVGNKRLSAIYICPICNSEFISQVYYVNKGDTTRCKKCKGIKHGLSSHPLYQIYKGILYRVLNKKSKSYCDYGGRGISICSEWKDSFYSFYEWSIRNGYQEGLSIDRIDNDGNYEPSNCRWTNQFMQSSNTRELRKGNTSGYRGVTFDKKNNKWIAQIRVFGKRKNLGRYATPELASEAYKKEEEKLKILLQNF